MSDPENGGQPGTSSDYELDDLNFLNFPPDIDWSTTLVLRCDPSGGPYKLIDVVNAMHFVVRRNDVHNLGPTALNHAFTITFKTNAATENFVRYLKNRKNKPLVVKNRPCHVTRIPSKCVTVSVRWIPTDIDTSHIIEVLKQYGTVVKTDLVRNDKQGWFHVYTGERKFHILLNEGVDVNSLPYSIFVKGLYGAVSVFERNPRCLDCYYNGHKSDSCKYKGCILYRE